MKVLVLGAGGLLGNAVFRVLGEKKDWEVFGALRSEDARGFFAPESRARLLLCDVEKHDELGRLFDAVVPDIVVNCVSPGKGAPGDALRAFSLFALLPHRLAVFCSLAGARLVHMSSDGVFSGKKGGYTEDDEPDAQDDYGRQKLLGEVRYPHTVSLRTSIIGHELQTAHGLLGWFLSREGSCRCYTRAIFSGLPTVELARVIRDFVIPSPGLSGVYHVAARPISKFDLLQLVAREYGKTINIEPDDGVVIDRSLDAGRFRAATGYVAPEWPELVAAMHSYH